jgi:hypothetical protein
MSRRQIFCAPPCSAKRSAFVLSGNPFRDAEQETNFGLKFRQCVKQPQQYKPTQGKSLLTATHLANRMSADSVDATSAVAKKRCIPPSCQLISL